MMTTGGPQRRSGIDDAILEAARLADRRSGLSVSDRPGEPDARQVADERTASGRALRRQTDEDALAAAIHNLTRRIRGMDENTRAVFTDLHGRLDDFAARLTAAGAGRRGADTALAEIAGIVEDLSRDIDDADDTARSTVEGVRRSRDQATASRHADRVTPAVGGLEQRPSPPSEAAVSPHDAAPPDSLGAIRAQVEALLAAAPEAPPDAAVETTLWSLESHLEEVNSRLFGQLAAGDPSSAVAGQPARRGSTDADADLGALASGQRQIPKSLEFLHDGLSVLADRIAALVDPVREKPGDADRLAAIEGEIVALRRTIETAEGPRAIARLERRTSELARAIEGDMREPAVGDAIGRLEARLDAAVGRIDAALDKSNLAKGLKDIKGEIAALARKLDAATKSDTADGATKEADGQGVRPTSRLEKAGLNAAGLESIEARLSHLQDLLTANRRESAEAARKAARDAAKAGAESARGGDIVQVLKPDLEEIRRASRVADARTHETLSAIQATLARVLDQLISLERCGDSRTAVAYEAFKATGTYGAERPLPRAERSSMAASVSSLEPRVVKPDLAALRELARSAAQGWRDETTGRKADFIAAARRAARAAAGEEPSPTSDDAGVGRTFARIGQAIRSRRRTLWVLAAASLAAASAVHMLGAGKSTPDEQSQAAISSAGSANEGVNVASVTVAAPVPSAASGGSGRGAEKPSTDSPSAFAFAAPERLDSRFVHAPPSPASRAFVRAADHIASLLLDEAIGSAALRKAAAGGDPNAAVEVAARYAEGRRVPRDIATAALWCEVAAESGVAVAQNRLASLYERGHGVTKNPTVAAAWYRRAAEQGNVGAMHNLAVMLSGAIEGAANYDEAAGWFRAAADRGVEDSQYNLGVIYARGLGLDRDLAESYKWFALAAASGDPEAAAHRDEVGEALSPNGLAKARAIVRAWRPRAKSEHANAVASLPESWRDPSEGITEAERRSLVMKIQALLAEQGYDPGPADGLEGPKTRHAIRAFQRNIGLAETGRISNDVVAALADPAG